MSIELGKFNQLEVVKEVDFGVYLDGGEEGEILLPTRYVPEDCKIGDFLNVFLYLDMDERLIATTLTPLVQVGQFACLEVAWVNQFGAFLNWGLMKDLFVPFSEQKMKMQVGRKYVIHPNVHESRTSVQPAMWLLPTPWMHSMAATAFPATSCVLRSKTSLRKTASSPTISWREATSSV